MEPPRPAFRWKEVVMEMQWEISAGPALSLTLGLCFSQGCHWASCPDWSTAELVSRGTRPLLAARANTLHAG